MTPVKARQLCRRHYVAWWRAKQASSSPRRSIHLEAGITVNGGLTAPVGARVSLCRRVLPIDQVLYKCTPPTDNRINCKSCLRVANFMGACSVSGCSQQVISAGVCRRHRDQRLNGGIRRTRFDVPLIRHLPTYSELALGDKYGQLVAWTKVDKEDLPRILEYSWSLRHSGYAGSTPGGYLHRFVMRASPGTVVHHVNANRRDNRKSNLRVVTTRMNNRESQKARKVGVRKTDLGKWSAGISMVFDTKAEAIAMRRAWEAQAGWHD